MKLNNRMRFILIGIVTFIWTFNFFAAAFDPHYKASTAVDAPFMAVVGYLLAGLKTHEDEPDEQRDEPAESEKSRPRPKKLGSKRRP